MVLPDPACKLSANLYDIYHCWVYSEKTPDDEQRNCLKHVNFPFKINLRNWCIWLVYYKDFFFFFCHMNVKLGFVLAGLTIWDLLP
jgi:hypothetical protein